MMRKQIRLNDGLSRGNRDHKGRFLPGNIVGKEGGRPKARRELEEAFRSVISENDIKELARKLLKLAKGGDLRAMKELLDRLLGKPLDPRVLLDDDYSLYDPSEEFL